MILAAGLAGASELAGRIAAGVRVDDPSVILERLVAEPRIGDEESFFVSWTVPLDGSAEMGVVDAIRSAGARPWVRVVFSTPAPLVENLDGLESELAVLAKIVRATGGGVFFQAVWRPAGGGLTAKELGYLIKRAAVVVTGAAPGAGFSAGP